MTYMIQAFTLTFIEAFCCEIYFDIFHDKKYQNRYINYLLFILLYLGFLFVSMISTEQYIFKAIAAILIIGIIKNIQYKGNYNQIVFLAIVYYGIVICIDRIMLIFLQYIEVSQGILILNNPVKITVVALICKMVLFKEIQ